MARKSNVNTTTTNTATDDRKKFSLYLPSELHAKIDALARHRNKQINNIFIELATEYVERNRAQLEIFERAEREAADLDAQKFHANTSEPSEQNDNAAAEPTVNNSENAQ